MKKSLFIVAGMFLFTVIFTSTPNANAQNCQTPPVLKELAKKLAEKCKSLEGSNSKFADCSKKIQVFKQLEDAWNSLVGNSSLKIGPREMEWNTVQTGNILAPGDRRFISKPIEDGKGATINIKKSGEGRAELVVNVCAVDIDTQAETNLASFTFDSDAKVGSTFNKSFSAAQVGKKIIVVFLNGKGLAKRFPLEFKASKN
jgi:hypothetical protein